VIESVWTELFDLAIPYPNSPEIVQVIKATGMKRAKSIMEEPQHNETLQLGEGFGANLLDFVGVHFEVGEERQFVEGVRLDRVDFVEA